MRIVLPALALAAVALVSSAEARAGDFTVGADFNIGVPIDYNGNNTVSTSTPIGLGFDGRLGYHVDVGPVYVQPEAQFGFMGFSKDDYTTKLLQVSGGARAGLRGLIQPNVFVHLGYGHVGFTSPTIGSTAALDGGDGGFLVDVGGALDFALPHLTLGIEGGFTDIAVTNASFKFVHFGPQAAIYF